MSAIKQLGEVKIIGNELSIGKTEEVKEWITDTKVTEEVEETKYSVFETLKEVRKYKYDDRGKEIENTFIHYKEGKFDWESISKIIIEYDENGNVISWEGYNSKVQYKYDKNGDEIERKSYNKGGSYDLYTFLYDSNRRIIEGKRIGYDKNGYMRFDDLNNQWYKYEYDTVGNKTIKQYYDFDTEEPLCAFIYKYNEGGDLIAEIPILCDYKYQSVSRGSYQYQYNDRGSIIEKIHFDDVNKNIYYFNDKGQKISSENYVDRALVRTYTYKYNIKGNLIEVIHKDASGWNGRTIIKYNNEGKVIERITYNNLL